MTRKRPKYPMLCAPDPKLKALLMLLPEAELRFGVASDMLVYLRDEAAGTVFETRFNIRSERGRFALASYCQNVCIALAVEFAARRAVIQRWRAAYCNPLYRPEDYRFWIACEDAMYDLGHQFMRWAGDPIC